MSDYLLELENVRVQFGSFLAIDDVTFRMRGGELLGMIGPNGAGKTTTLRASAGLQPVTTGTVRIMGHDVFRHPTYVGEHLGFTPDEPALYDSITVSDYLRFIGKCYGLPASLLAERIDHWLAELWLEEKKSERIGSLSRGMRQRLAVARTLLPDPHVVLLDEPAAGLDPAGRVKFRRLLASLRDQGKAIIVSSHILADLSEYCTHIAIVSHGKFVKYGTVAQIAAGGGEAAHTRYRVVLAARSGDLEARLGRVREKLNVGAMELDGDTLVLEYGAERVLAAQLLKALLDEDLQVAEFGAVRHDLEQAYLQTGIRQVD